MSLISVTGLRSVISLEEIECNSGVHISLPPLLRYGRQLAASEH